MLAYSDECTPLFRSIIDTIYPRFWVEKHRFSSEFFLAKGQQVIWRSSGGLFLLGITLFSHQLTNVLKTGYHRFFEVQTTPKAIKWLRILYFTFLLGIVNHWYWDLQGLQILAPFYKPILLLRIFPHQLPPHWLLAGLYFLMLFGIGMCLLNRKTVFFSALVISLFIYLHGVFCSFEKMDHAYVTYIYAGMVLPFVFLEKQNSSTRVNAWPIRLIQLLICLTYLMAGLEKLLISGIDWASVTTFKTYLAAHSTPAGLWVAKQDVLCQLLPIGALAFQLGFWLILPFPKLRWVFLPWGITFHFGVVILFGISSFFNPWVWVYIFFLVPIFPKTA